MDLRLDKDCVVLDIVDDGEGFHPEAGRGSGLGLASMAARAREVGGSLVVDSSPGKGTRVVVRLAIRSYADNRFVLAAMEAGADGYLLKESGGERIVAAIRTIVNGGTVFDPVIARRALGRTPGASANPLGSLTQLEGQVLAEVAKGRTDKEVATVLNLTPKTARNYVSRIFGKLNVHTRTEAALVYARHSGFLTEDAGRG